jgi:hypothetical protein
LTGSGEDDKDEDDEEEINDKSSSIGVNLQRRDGTQIAMI